MTHTIRDDIEESTPPDAPTAGRTTAARATAGEKHSAGPAEGR
jgi:hypothetical protein